MFGGGPHACLGKKFVTLELKAVLATMLRRFDLRLATSNVRKNPKQVFFTARPLGAVMVEYRSRGVAPAAERL
jgi:cytochrome P450